METPDKPDGIESTANLDAAPQGSEPEPQVISPAVFSEDAATVITGPKPSLPARPIVTPRELGSLLIGVTLGQIRLDEFIGGGGMGAVFRGEDIRLGRPVAVKVISGDRTDEDTLRRFHNEAQSAARLDHPNIARVYHVGEDEGWHYIVFEYIKGVNIRDLVEFKGPLPIDEALSYTLQVAQALDHAYRRDVVHRDIKPSNVLVMPNGDVKLVDMGLARLHDVESPKDDITASGVTLGTFDYISPEQARDPRSADVRSDLYSLGCTLYFMLTGQPPFPDGTVLQKLLSHSSEEPPDVRIFRPDLEDEIVSVLTKLMAKQPSARQQSPRDLIDDIYYAAGQLDLPLSPPAGNVVRETPRASWLGQMAPWAISFALMAASAFGVEWLDRSGTPLTGPVVPDLPPAPVREAVQPSVERVVDPGDSAAATQPKETNPATPAEEESPLAAWTNPSFDTPDWLQWPQYALADPLAGGPLPMEDREAESVVETDDPQAVVPIQRIVVAPNPDAIETKPDAIVVEDLATAMEALDLHGGASTIELHFNGPLTQPPLRLVLPRALTISAGAGYEPELSFQPQLSDIGADLNAIEVAGESLVLSGVHLSLTLPPEPADGWTLLFLEDIASIELNNATLTIENADDFGQPRQPNVAFLGFKGRMLRSEMRMPTDDLEPTSAPRPPIRIVQLSRTAVRGEAAFMRVQTSESIALNWTQGLLASTGRFAEILGAPAFPEASVHIDLDHVTVAAQEGLVRVDLAEGAASPPELHLNMNRCIVDASGQGALVEHFGVEKESLAERRFSFTGAENFYTDAIGLRWLLRLQDGAEVENAFDDKDASWYQELQGVKAVMWKDREGADLPFHRHRASMYLQDDRPANPSAEAGFAVDELPQFPVSGDEESATDSGETEDVADEAND